MEVRVKRLNWNAQDKNNNKKTTNGDIKIYNINKEKRIK